MEDNIKDHTEANMAEAIAKLEGLIQQVTALADADTLQPKSSQRRTRRLSKNTTDQGYRYLASADPSRSGAQPNQKPRRQVTFQEERGLPKTDHASKQPGGPGDELLPGAPRIAEPVLSTEAAGETLGQSHGRHHDPRAELWQTYAKSPPPDAAETSGPQLDQPIARSPTRVGLPPELRTDRDHRQAADRATNNSSPSPRSADPNVNMGRHFTQMFGTQHHHSVFKYDRSKTSDSHIVDLRRVNHVDL
jgi:hypothetical protein